MILDKVIYNTETKEPVEIDIDNIIKGRALFQANSGGGKSYITRKFLEESNGKVQQIIIDPEGEFSTLREKYDYLLVGKDNADIQIDIRHAELLAKRLMETGADAIIDLYEMSIFERIRFVKIFVNALVNLPKRLWHPCFIVIDEIHVFAPESSKGRSESLEAVSSLASRGRKRGYALIGATQKLSKFHKDVASELNTKFTGRCTLDIDQKRAAQELGIKKHTELRNLDFEFYVFGPGINGTIKVKSYPVKTTHEDIGNANPTKIANPRKIKKLMTDFAELPQEAVNELKTTSDLKQKIADQNLEITNLKRTVPTKQSNPNELANALEKGYNRGIDESKPTILKQQENIKNLEKKLLQINNLSMWIALPNIEMPKNHTITVSDKIEIVHTPKLEARKPDLPNDMSLGVCDTAILKATAQFDSPSRRKIAAVSGYAIKKSTFRNGISSLFRKQYITKSGNNLQITPEGLQALGDYTPLPTDHQSLLQHWKNEAGLFAGNMLQILCEIHPNFIEREDLAIRLDTDKTISTFRNGISTLNSLGLLEKNGSSVAASKEMFP